MRRSITLGAAIVLAACGGDEGIDLASASPFCQQVIPAVNAFMAETEAARPAPSDDRYGGTVVVAGLGEILGGMNAAAPNDIVALQHQQFVNLMTLLDYDEEAMPRAYLAEKWEVSDDGREITFYIRQDV
jgi:ABC-type transport system substrate-binding protein